MLDWGVLMSQNLPIDPAASIYGLVRRAKENRTLVNSMATMQMVTSEIENVMLLDGVRTRVFAGFEYMSIFMPQVERYRQIAQNAECVYVFAVMDVEPPTMANVRFIPVRDNTPLTQEWFLVADSADYFTALCAEEQSAPDAAEQDRTFEGVWSFDEGIVTIIQEWLTHLVHAAPLDNLHKRRNHNKQVSLMSRMMTRLVEHMVQSPDKNTVRKPHEINQVIHQQLIPAMQSAMNKLPILNPYDESVATPGKEEVSARQGG